MARVRRLLAPVVLLASACQVFPAEYAGFECDKSGQHGCFDGRVCVASRCVPPPVSEDGGAVEVAECVRWRQASNGFASKSNCPGCSVTWDDKDRNRLTATVKGGNGSNDNFAFAVVVPAASASNEGHLRGRFAETRALDGEDLMIRISAGANPLFELTIDNNGAFTVNSAANTLQAAALKQGPTPQRFNSGEHQLDLIWKQGEVRTFQVDGVTLLTQQLTPFSGGSASPTELSLGIVRQNGGDGWGVSLREFVLCDDASAAF